MANLVDKAGDIQKFLHILSWRKLTQLVVFILIIGLAYATFENREVIYGFATQKRIDGVSSTVTDLSKSTISDINTIVERSDMIVGIQIILANFQKNERVSLYSYIDVDNPELKSIYSHYLNTSIGNESLFSSDEEENKHLVKIINGEFACRPFSDAHISKIFPEAVPYIKYSCTNSIPASYGKFMGMVIINLNRTPTADEYDQLRTVAKKLATEIFEKDLSSK